MPALTVSADASGNVYVADGTPGDLIQLDNQLNGAADGNQIVTFADGSSMTAAQLVALETTETAGADRLYGSVSSDLFDGEGAPAFSQDYEQGNGGGDTFVFNAGYGRLEINELDQASSPTNVLQLGPGIGAAQLTVTGDYAGTCISRLVRQVTRSKSTVSSKALPMTFRLWPSPIDPV